MSRYSVLVLVFLGLLISSCSLRQNDVVLSKAKLDQSRVNENYLLLEALMNKYYDLNQTRASEIFSNFYYKYKSYPYLVEALKISLHTDEGAKSDKLFKSGFKRYPKSMELKKLYVNRLIQKKQYQKAKSLMFNIIKKEKTSENYMVLGSIYYLQKDYKKAYFWYKKSYALVTDEKTLLKLASVLDENLHKTKKAIEYLESYIRLKSSSKQVYFKLLQIYSRDFKLKGLISTYKLLYRDFGDNAYASKIVELYMYGKDKEGAKEFLKQSGHNPSMLLDLYVQDRQFRKAYTLAKKMYAKEKSLDLLGRMAIYQYESSGHNLSKKTLRSISKKFERLLEKRQDPLYLNYYGYLLIDHNINIKKGIAYVKMALKQEPNSAYYLDSLAWGYYKLGKCKKALKIMQKIIKTNKEKEIIEHYRIIKKCKR